MLEGKQRGEERLWVIIPPSFFTSTQPANRTCLCNFRFISFPVVETEAGEKAAKEEAVVENTTPDYAAGLVSAQVLDSACFVFLLFLTLTVLIILFCLILPSPLNVSLC